MYSIFNKVVVLDNFVVVVLNWEEIEEKGLFNLFCEEMEKDDDNNVEEEEIFEEEDLYGECNCFDCEIKMFVVLVFNYIFNWICFVRRKYLVDWKEVMNE